MRQSHGLQPQTAQPGADDEAELRRAIQAKLVYSLGKSSSTASDRDWFLAIALALRDRIVDAWMEKEQTAAGEKCVNYLSIEFLIGRLLCDALTNLGQVDSMKNALMGLGLDFDRIRALEPDPALGSGGLGRLAACFLDSMAALGVPSYGYGIRYRLGLFKQHLAPGWPQGRPPGWVPRRNPPDIARPPVALPPRF